MTKEKLEKEAREWLCNNLHSASEEDFIKAMVDIAEPREKQIAELSKHIVELQKDKGELVDRIKELEKENADLRAFKEKCKFNVSDICKEIETENQLAEAKEIIRAVLNDVNDKNGCRLTMGIYIKAEQFLKETQ